MSETSQNPYMGDAFIKLTVRDILKNAVTDTSSLWSLINNLKDHSLFHVNIICSMRNIREECNNAKRDYEEIIAQHVSDYSQDSKSATAVQNYAKYDVQVVPEVMLARVRFDRAKSELAFLEDVNNAFSTRANILINMIKQDKDMYESDRKAAPYNVDVARAANAKADDLIRNLNTPYGGDGVL